MWQSSVDPQPLTPDRPALHGAAPSDRVAEGLADRLADRLAHRPAPPSAWRLAGRLGGRLSGRLSGRAGGRALLTTVRWPLNAALWLALQLHLLALGLMSLGGNLLALLLHPLLPRATGRRLGRAMIAWGYGQFWRIAARTGMMQLDAQALDTLRDEQGLIVVANHPSMLDAMMLVARLPRSACIMKASLLRNPLLGPGARLARYIRNDSAYGMVHCAVADLRAGGQLVLFPEGTRTTQAPLNPFHASFTLISKRAGVPIQTVFIDTDSPYLGKGWPLWRLPPLPIRFAVRLGRRFDAPVGTDHHVLRQEIHAYFAQAVHVPRHLVP